jgi:hypothetical protein
LKPQFPNGLAKQLFVRYDPASGNESVFNFLEFVDAFSLGLPTGAPIRQNFSGSWATRWSSIMPFKLNGAACQLAYNTTTGDVHFDQMAANGNGAITQWSYTWGAGFTHMVPYYINGAPQFIAYNSADGQAHFDAFPDNLQGPIINAIRTWPTGLTSITPFEKSGRNYFLLYNATTGAVRVDLVNTAGNNSSLVWSGNWGTGWSDFFSYPINGQPYLVAYNADTGLIHYDRFWGGLNGTETQGSATIEAGLRLTKLDFAGPASFLAYGGDGTARIRRLALDGTGSDEAWRTSVLASGTQHTSFLQDGKTYMQIYKRSTGTVRNYEVALF